MSIIKKTEVGIDAHYQSLLNTIKESVNEKPGYDMLGRELKPYDWVMAFTSYDGRIEHRLGYVVKHTAKQTTIMCYMRTWGEDHMKKTSISPRNIIKVPYECVKELAEKNSI